MQYICPSPNRLREFLDGSVGDAETSQISEHVAECLECDSVLGSLESEQSDVLNRLREGVPTEILLQEPEFEQLRNTIRFGQSDSNTLHDAEEQLETGKRLRDYRLVKKIGEGGMGTVYQAFHLHLAKHVALKILPADKLTSSQSVKRFRQEMRAVGKVNHPNVVSASDAGTIDGQHFLVMELVQGADLARMMQDRGPLKVADACEIVRQAATGLQHAHDNGLVHRDVKPSNIMLAVDGNVKLLDLGLAGLNNTDFEPTANVVVTDRLTSVGQILGTLDYMAPEQITASPQVDGKADIYALGATLFQLLTGKTPCGNRTEGTPARIAAVLHKPPLDIATLRNDVPDELRGLLLKMLAKNPADRPPTASAVADELKRFTNDADLVALAEWCKTSLDIPSVDVDVTDDVSFVVSRAVQPQADIKSPSRFPAIALACLGIFLVLLATVVYQVQTNNGVVLVEVNDPGLKVEVSEQTITVNEGNKKPLTIRAGEQSLVIRDGNSDLEFETDRFQIRRGDKIAFKVERIAGDVVVSKDGENFARKKANKKDAASDPKDEFAMAKKTLGFESAVTAESFLKALAADRFAYPLDEQFPVAKQPKSWGGKIRLQTSVREESGQLILFSPVLDLLQLASKTNELNPQVYVVELDTQLEKLSETNGEYRIEAGLASTVFAFQRGDLKTAKERLTNLAFMREYSSYAGETTYDLNFWLVARYALAFEESAAIGRQLADRSLKAAEAMPEPRFKSAILQERGKLLKDDQREIAKAAAKSGDLKKAREILRTIPGVGSAKAPSYLEPQLPRFDSDAAVAFKLAEVQRENGEQQAAADSYLEAFRLSGESLIDFPFIDFFKEIGRGGDLADLYTESRLKKTGIYNYFPRRLYETLVADEATRTKAYELLERHWKNGGDDVRFDYLGKVPASFRDNPDKLFYLRSLLLPQDFSAEGSGWKFFNRFQPPGSLLQIKPLLQDQEVVQQVADEVRAGTEKYPQWNAGVATLSFLEAELGNFDRSVKLLERVLATKEQSIPFNSAKILGRSIEGKDKQLDQLVIRLYEYNLANETYEYGNYASPAINLAKLYQQADQKSESRRAILRLSSTQKQSCGKSFTESDGMSCTLCHAQERSITDYNKMTGHLTEIGYPIDALLLQSRIDRSFKNILSGNQEWSQRALPELGLKYYDDEKQKFLAIKTKAEQGLTPQSAIQAFEEGQFLNEKKEFDLRGTIRGESGQSTYSSPVLDILKLTAQSKAAGSAEAIAAIDARLLSICQANPRDVKAAVAATVFAFERNDLNAAEERLKKLQEFKDFALDEIPNSDNLSIWFAARLALQNEQTKIIGTVLAERVLTNLGENEFVAGYRNSILRERTEIRTK